MILILYIMINILSIKSISQNIIILQSKCQFICNTDARYNPINGATSNNSEALSNVSINRDSGTWHLFCFIVVPKIYYVI